MTLKSAIHCRLNRGHLIMTDKKQIDKFREVAKELECDESEKAFNKKLKKLTEKPVNKSS